jgi:predicted dehydrogenase
MRVMMIGAGAIAYRHAAAIRDLADAELVAVCDLRRESVDALGDQFQVEARFTDLDALLRRETADVATVATWGVAHADTVERVARSGRVRAILCEKPLAMDAAEAERMFRVAEEHGVLLAEAFRLRSQPIHLRAIELIRGGRIGEVIHVRNAMMWRVPDADRDPERNWRFNRANGGGVTYDIGCYCINQLRWAMNSEPVRVFAEGRWGPTGVDEHVVAVAEFADGRTAEWCVSWQAGRHHVSEVIGTDGVVRIENAWGDGPGTATTIEVMTGRGQRETEVFAATDQFRHQLEHLADCLQHGTAHRIPPSDSIAQMRVIDAVYESLRTGKPAEVR